ncbi:hypothetical protein EPB69_15930 [Geobacillus stearothermophilus]|nr:hypothetical protein EPB69_15930 [Geobacillus stearothermophilus]
MKKRHRSRTLLSLGMAFSLALLGSGPPTMASAAMTKHSADASLLLDRLGLSERSDKLKTAAQKKGSHPPLLATMNWSLSTVIPFPLKNINKQEENWLNVLLPYVMMSSN